MVYYGSMETKCYLFAALGGPDTLLHDPELPLSQRRPHFNVVRRDYLLPRWSDVRYWSGDPVIGRRAEGPVWAQAADCVGFLQKGLK